MKHTISVQKYMYCTGTVTAEGESPDDAVMAVEDQIAQGQLKTTDVEWGEPQYEDCSFETTGDVDSP